MGHKTKFFLLKLLLRVDILTNLHFYKSTFKNLHFYKSPFKNLRLQIISWHVYKSTCLQTFESTCLQSYELTFTSWHLQVNIYESTFTSWHLRVIADELTSTNLHFYVSTFTNLLNYNLLIIFVIPATAKALMLCSWWRLRYELSSLEGTAMLTWVPSMHPQTFGKPPIFINSWASLEQSVGQQMQSSLRVLMAALTLWTTRQIVCEDGPRASLSKW